MKIIDLPKVILRKRWARAWQNAVAGRCTKAPVICRTSERIYALQHKNRSLSRRPGVKICSSANPKSFSFLLFTDLCDEDPIPCLHVVSALQKHTGYQHRARPGQRIQVGSTDCMSDCLRKAGWWRESKKMDHGTLTSHSSLSSQVTFKLENVFLQKI